MLYLSIYSSFIDHFLHNKVNSCKFFNFILENWRNTLIEWEAILFTVEQTSPITLSWESFFSSMKKEEFYRKYMGFYNMKRPHATLDYRAPNTYERLFYVKQEQKAN